MADATAGLGGGLLALARAGLVVVGIERDPTIARLLRANLEATGLEAGVIAALSAERDISQRMLTLRLRALERDGFVARREHDTVPPRVDYALTDLGRGLAGELDRVIRWIEANSAEVEAARARFGE